MSANMPVTAPAELQTIISEAHFALHNLDLFLQFLIRMTDTGPGELQVGTEELFGLFLAISQGLEDVRTTLERSGP